jgi:RNA polymerase sigma-70 factor (ECF subfamily)
MNKPMTLELVGGGDQHERFLALFMRHQGDLRAFVRSVIPSPAMADDVLQEVALALWRGFERYDPARPFGAWARGVAANTVLKSLRSNRRAPLVFAPEAMQALVDAFSRADPPPADTSALRECMGRLPDRSRALLRLRYEEALKLPEIAERTSSTVEAIHKALCRIRVALHKCLQRRMAAGRSW